MTRDRKTNHDDGRQRGDTESTARDQSVSAEADRPDGRAGRASSSGIGTGRRLPPYLAHRFGERFGHNFGGVRVHDGAGAARAARALDARAFTIDEQVVFGDGEYAPDTPAGFALLGHELAHVVQQSGTPTGTHDVQRAPTDSTVARGEDTGYEREARRASASLLRGDRPTVRRRTAEATVLRTPWGECPAGKRLSGQPMTRWLSAEYAAIALYRTQRPGNQLLTNENLSGVGQREVLVGGDRKLIEAIFDQFRSSGTPSPIQPTTTVDPGLADQVPGGSPHEATEGRDPAKEPRRQVPKEPDIVDLTTREVYDVTTKKQAAAKATKVAEQYVEALNSILRSENVGGPDFTAGTTLPRPASYVIPRPRPGSSRDVVICFGPTDFDAAPGVLAYEVIERSEKRRREPEPNPVPILVPVTLAAGALAAYLQQYGKKLGQKLGGRVLPPQVQAAVVLLAVTIIASDANAEVTFGGEGEDPLTAMFDYFASNGTPVPKELRERIEANPELKRILEDAAASGEMSKVQQKLAAETTKLINDNLDQFSDEDLQRLSEAAALAQGEGAAATSVAELQRGLAQARSAKASGAGTGEPDGETAPEETPESPTESDGQTRLPEETPTHVRSLYEYMVRPGAEGPTVTEAFVDEFVRLTAELTPEQAASLQSTLRPIEEGQSIEDVLRELRTAVRHVTKQTAEKPAAGETATDETDATIETEQADSRAGTEVEGTPGAETTSYATQMRAAIAEFKRWEEVTNGTYLRAYLNDQAVISAYKAAPDEGVDAVAIYFLRYEGVKYAALVEIRITKLVETSKHLYSAEEFTVTNANDFIPLDESKPPIPWARLIGGTN